MESVTICVHNGSFHADDVFAVAVLKLVHPDAKIIRSRDPQVIKKSDFRVDVGGHYDPETGDFDHHQIDDTGERPNGIPYASIGLVWKHYGPRLTGSAEIASLVDGRLIQIIDANDSGITLPFDESDPPPYNLPQLIDSFNPVWYLEPQDFDGAFLEAVEFAKKILMNEIQKMTGKVKARDIVLQAIKEANGSSIIRLNQYCPWQDQVIGVPGALYVIFPAPAGDWRVRAVPVKKGSFETRKPLPESWAGKNDSELAAVTGVSDAKFCHKDRFITGAYSREGAEKLARLAAEN